MVSKKNKKGWSANSQEIPDIDPHTQAKHRILERYIKNMIITLYGKTPYGERTFTFIDGFCGGGIYENKEKNEKWYGSPIRIIQAVREGFYESKRKYDLNVKYIFIDYKSSHLSCLRNYAMPQVGFSELANLEQQIHKSELGSQLYEECEFIEGTFEEKVNYCLFLVEGRKGHSFFFLDPYGWTHVSMESIRKINRIKGSEILFNYMIDYIKRFIVDRNDKLKHGFSDILETEGYYELANLEKMNKKEQQCYLRNESMRLFRDKGNVRYMITFSMIPKGNLIVLYYLMHFSQSPKAIEVMKDSFYQENNVDFQHYLELYGFTFKTAEFYQEHMFKLEYDTTKDNETVCLEKLDIKIRDMIMKNDDGILYEELIHQTMEKTPATAKQYNNYINRLAQDKEIEVFRNNHKQKQKKIALQKGDIIRKTYIKQIRLF